MTLVRIHFVVDDKKNKLKVAEYSIQSALSDFRSTVYFVQSVFLSNMKNRMSFRSSRSFIRFRSTTIESNDRDEQLMFPMTRQYKGFLCCLCATEQ